MSGDISQITHVIRAAGRELTGSDREGMESLGCVRVIAAWAQMVAFGHHGASPMPVGGLEQASLGQFALAAQSITASLASELHRAATPERDAERFAALDDLGTAASEAGVALRMCGALPADPEGIRALAGLIRALDSPDPAAAAAEAAAEPSTEQSPATPFQAMIGRPPNPATLLGLDVAIAEAARARTRPGLSARLRRRRRRDRELSVARGDVLVEAADLLAAGVAAVGAGAAPIERAAFENLAQRARWHRERVATLDT